MLLREYDFYLADTDGAKSIHYNLRYQVYCLREKFEEPSNFPSFLEQDKYDNRSAHFIARSRATGEWLGAMRLIVASVDKLPISTLASLDTNQVAAVMRKRAAEASRLCTLMPTSVRGRFASHPETAKRYIAPHRLVSNALHASTIAVGLIGAARQYCLRHDISHCFFLISEPLARILRRLGMDIQPVGSPCLHRGWRRPYIHNVRTGYRAMSARSPQLYKFFSQTTAYRRFSDLEIASAARNRDDRCEIPALHL